MARFRYKYGRRGYRRNSTRSIMMKFQSFMDISTNDTSMQIITISAGGKDVLRRLSAQFSAYKYYKLGNVAVKLVPASTLPVDPTGLSYSLDEGSEMTVDPRDQLTPGMMRITNGEDVFEDITGLSDDVQHGIYNNMLLDPRWFKWMLQSGVKRHATPRYWQIGQLHQDHWPGSIVNVPVYAADGSMVGTGTEFTRVVDGTSNRFINNDASVPVGLFQTGHSGRLGWLPTDGINSYGRVNGKNDAMIASVPEVEVMKIILPKAYKTRYYYRMFVTETVYFREPIMNFGIGPVNEVYRPLDVFHYPTAPYPLLPNESIGFDFPTDAQTGGNYGDD